jgi:hypothetical protein
MMERFMPRRGGLVHIPPHRVNALLKRHPPSTAAKTGRCAGQRDTPMLRQLVYISSVKGPAVAIDPETILIASRRNNAQAGITGLLYFDGRRFLQALEGEAEAVERLYRHIAADPRHHALVVLSDRHVEAREFGDWAMGYAIKGEDKAALIERIARLAASATPEVRATFESFAGLKRLF